MFFAYSGGKHPFSLSKVVHFSNVDFCDVVLYHHDDLLVILVPINQALVRRTLVDTGPQVDLITLDAL